MLKTAILIPALEPDDKLLRFLNALTDLGLTRIVLVDDGSSGAAQHIFKKAEQLGAAVIHHDSNRGKGAAIKTGIQFLSEQADPPDCIITADADGQHLAEDAARLAAAAASAPDSLILGVRTFSGSHVPQKSRIGNRIASFFFKISTGISCHDTQTGLRAIPAALFPLALLTEGSRYEYEMQFLEAAVRQAPLQQIPIITIYEDGNRCSHFHPLRDSLLIIGKPLRFLTSSALCAGADYLLFILYLVIISGLNLSGASMLRAASITADAGSLLGATVFSRTCSGLINFLLNKYWSFRSRGNPAGESVRYAVLFLTQMTFSSLGTIGLSAFIPSVPAKIITDCTLFLLSYHIQKKWVFQEQRARHKTHTRQSRHPYTVVPYRKKSAE